MVNLVSGTRNGAESASISEWREYFECPQGKRLVRDGLLQDPLSYVSFRGQIVHAVFGYLRNGSSAELVYFWCRGLSQLRIESLANETDESSLLRLASMLSEVCGVRPKFSQLRMIWEGKFSDATDFLGAKNDSFDLYWYESDDLILACLYDRAEPAAAVRAQERSSSSTLMECLAFHCDYFQLRSVLWNSVPMRYLNKVLENQPDRLVKAHLETKLFKPNKEHREKRFEWPWQRSIEHDIVQLESSQYHSLKYRPVPTVSLVADLRKSTRALEQLPSEYVGEFSAFLTEIVDIAREKVFEFGGFFDKETGDGIVGHFVDFTQLGEVDSARRRAFHAAEKMIQDVNLRCVALQKKLHLGVEGLGISVGVHQQEAVWVTEADQVRAIGPSVVLAARLCGDAERSSIFVSNSFFEKLQHELPSSTLSRFSKKEYSGKEHDPHVGLYGYQLGIGEAHGR